MRRMMLINYRNVDKVLEYHWILQEMRLFQGVMPRKKIILIHGFSYNYFLI